MVSYMFDYMGDEGTFWFFGGCSLIAGVAMIFFMKETKGLTQEQTKVLYVPKNLLKVETVSMVEDPKTRASYDAAIGNTIVRSTTASDSVLSPLVADKKLLEEGSPEQN